MQLLSDSEDKMVATKYSATGYLSVVIKLSDKLN